MIDDRPLWQRLYEDGYEQSEALFADTVEKEVQALAGTAMSLRDTLHAATVAFLDAKVEENDFQSEKTENAALERVAKSANALHEALCDLYMHGETTQKLARAIQANAGIKEGNPAHHLSNMLVVGSGSFQPLQNLAIDLAMAAEDAINRKPKPIAEEDHIWAGNSLAAYEARMAAWRTRSAEHRLPRDHSIRAFLRKFRQGWEESSPHPFTEGMYYREARSTASFALDAAEAALKALDPNITRSRIVTAMRALRAEGNTEENLS